MRILNTEVTESGFDVFLNISAQLTGFSKEELAGTGMHETYYYDTLMREADQVTVRSFLSKAKEILDNGVGIDQKIKRCFVLPTGQGPSLDYDRMPYDGLARRVILLWYTGIWTTMNWKDKKEQRDRTAMVSAEAYKQGLIWTAAETHPAGANQPGYSSWSKKPL